MAYRIAPIPYIYNAISEGLNATRALEQFRAQGGAIRTQRFYHAYGEVAAELAVADKLASLPPESVPTADVIRQISSTRPGAYLVRGGAFVSVRTINPLTGRVQESTQISFGSLRMENLMTLGEMETQIEELFGPQGQSGLAHSTVIGSKVFAIGELVAPVD